MTNIIPHTFNGATITQKRSDGYICATAMCKVAGKKFNDYARLDTTKAFLEVLASETGSPVSQEIPVAGIPATEQNQGLIVQIKGGTPDLQGTWVHPKAAIHLGHWLSPEFAVWCTTVVHDWMAGTLEAPPAVEDTRRTNHLTYAQELVTELDRTNRELVALEDWKSEVRGELTRMVSVIADYRPEPTQPVAAIQNDGERLTVAEFCRSENLTLPTGGASLLGVEASRICRERQLSIGRVDDSRFKKVNTYPVGVLKEALQTYDNMPACGAKLNGAAAA